jgi:hypothetical protein
VPESPSSSAAPRVAEEAVPGPSATGDTTTEGAAANGTGKRAGAAKKAAKTSRAAAAKVSGAAKRAARAWVDPKGAFCPSSHPIKGKLSSGIYHLPGMLAYDRTTPDRCYQSEDGAQNDGLRKAKR